MHHTSFVLLNVNTRTFLIDWELLDAKLPLHLFQRIALCFRIHSQYDEELHYHHGRKENEWRASRRCRQHRERYWR